MEARIVQRERPLQAILVLGVAAFVTTTLTSSCALFGGGIEKASYSVLEKDGRFEIRLFEPCIVAETVVESDFAEAGNVAFRRLYDYISGENRKRESIAMTAPVSQEARSEKIAMTAPVSQERSGDKWVVSFLMPDKYTMQTLPEPVDPAVTLREVPARKMAAVRYSGTWSKKRYEEQRARLEEFIEDQGLEIVGEAVFARYDPPFQLPFLRRNEVLIPVQ
jgi:effector-binding domain-containing protein